MMVAIIGRDLTLYFIKKNAIKATKLPIMLVLKTQMKHGSIKSEKYIRFFLFSVVKYTRAKENIIIDM